MFNLQIEIHDIKSCFSVRAIYIQHRAFNRNLLKLTQQFENFEIVCEYVKRPFQVPFFSFSANQKNIRRIYSYIVPISLSHTMARKKR